MVHQHLLQVSTYSVVENVVLGTSEKSGGLRNAARRITELSDRFGLAVDPRARTNRLSVGARQRVEILKVLYRGARILILDEPTTNLTPQEVDDLFASLRVIVAEGTSVVFISHKAREVLAICDRISVMRDGRRMTTVHRSDTDATGLASLMVGRARRPSSPRSRRRARPRRGRRGRPGGEPARSPSRRATAARRRRTSWSPTTRASRPSAGSTSTVRSGEVLGVAGVAGNGQVELAEALAGVRPAQAGTVQVDDTDLAGAQTRRWIDCGCRLRARGPAPRRHPRRRLGHRQPAARCAAQPRVPEGRADRLAAGARARPDDDRPLLDQDARAPTRRPANLSGGNIQRLVLARAFDREPAVLVLQNPTRGLDLRSITVRLRPGARGPRPRLRRRPHLRGPRRTEPARRPHGGPVLRRGRRRARPAATTTPTSSAGSWPASGRPHDRPRPHRAGRLRAGRGRAWPRACCAASCPTSWRWSWPSSSRGSSSPRSATTRSRRTGRSSPRRSRPASASPRR